MATVLSGRQTVVVEDVVIAQVFRMEAPLKGWRARA
jgi:hypothetical protein